MISSPRSSLMLLFFSLVILSPLAGELFLRAGIAAGFEPFRRPELYADLMSDDDFWILQNRWQRRFKLPDKNNVHTSLGWSQAPQTPDNPWGLKRATLQGLSQKGRRKVLFYGDSFVRGSAADGKGIPDIMQGEQDVWDVLHLGVGGYGTDQSYLFFRETYPGAEDPVIVMGVYMEDMDRAALKYRVGQKPYFVFDPEGHLKLQGVPVERDQEAYLKKQKLKFRSYLLRFLQKKLGFYNPGKETETFKRRLNLALADEVIKICEEKKLPLLYVFFYHSASLRQGAPGPSYLETYVSSRGIPVLNTGDLVVEDSVRNHRPIDDYYAEDKGHHNALGNQVIAAGVLKRLDAYLK